MCSSADDPSMHDIAPDTRHERTVRLLVAAGISRETAEAMVSRVVDGVPGPGIPDPLREAAERIALESPWVGWEVVDCRHCGRDWYLNGRNPDQTGDRRAHEPDCSWIALRDVLGMYSG